MASKLAKKKTAKAAVLRGVFSEVVALAEAKNNIPQWARSIENYAAQWGPASTIATGCRRLRVLLEGSSGVTPNEWFVSPFNAWYRMVMDGVNVCFDVIDARPSGSSTPAKKSAEDKLKAKFPWLEAEVMRLAKDAAREMLLCDNAVAYWLDGFQRVSGAPAVTIMDTERVVSYTDGFAGEIMKVSVEKAAGDFTELPDRWRAALKSGGNVELDPEDGDNFRVATMQKRGKGLVMPSSCSLFEIIGMLQLIALSDHSAAWSARTIIRQFLIGHEIKYGTRAGYSDHFIDKETVDNLKKKVATGEGGPMDLYSNFDVAVKHVGLDKEHFSRDKYESGMLRLAHFNGAVEIMNGEKVGDGVWESVRSRVWEVRDAVSGLIEGVVNSEEYGLGLKGPIVIGWNPFTGDTAKSAVDKMRFGTSQGLMSARTARLALHLNANIEARRMADERLRMEENTPYFEQKQGATTPDAAPAGDPAQGGRPPEN